MRNRTGAVGIALMMMVMGFFGLVGIFSDNATAQTWRIEIVDDTGKTGRFPSIVLDSGGNPHISYFDETNDDLMYAKWNTSSWIVEPVFSAGSVGWTSSIALDADEHPHIAFYDYFNGALMYAEWTGSDWDIQTVDSTVMTIGWHPSLVIDHLGVSHISYADATNGHLKYAKWGGLAWIREFVDSANNVGGSSSLALDSNNHPHISYYDSNNKDLKYAKWTGTAWDIIAVDSTGRVGQGTTLALDENDHPHIAYHDGSNEDLKYARWNGSRWLRESVDGPGDVGENPSLTVDNGGYAQICYYSVTNGDLRLAKWTPTAWRIEVVDGDGDVGKTSSMVLDSEGNAHLAYHDLSNGDLKYATRAHGKPSEPEGLQAVAGDSMITLTWEEPSSDGGSPIENYRIYRGTSPSGESFLTQVVNVQDYYDMGLTNGETYYYQVMSVTAAGESVLSDEASAKPAGVPDAPTGLIAMSGDSYVKLEWDAPAFDGGSPISNYIVYKGTMTGGESFLGMVASVLTYSDTSTSNGIKYYYRVSAMNQIGEGGLSGEVDAIPVGVPDAPSDLVILTGDGYANITWSAPESDGGLPITNYRLYRGTSSGGEVFLTKTGNERTYNDTNVVNGMTHFYEVSAVNGVGEGALSDEVAGTPSVLVNQIPNCTVSSPSSDEKISGISEISGLAVDGDGSIHGVEIRVDDGSWMQTNGTTSWRFYWDTKTVPNGRHTVHVRSFDGTDYSMESSISIEVRNAPMSLERPLFEETWFWAFIAMLAVIIALSGALVARKKKLKVKEGIEGDET